MVLRSVESRRRMGGGVEGEGFRRGKGAPTVFLNAKNGSTARSRRRLHLQRDEERAREGQEEDEGVVRHQGPGGDG